MCDGWGKCQIGEVVHGPLQVNIVLGFVCINPCRDGSLDGVEDVLCFSASDELQPFQSVLRIWSTFWQSECVGYNHECIAGLRYCKPTEFFSGCPSHFFEVTFCPVSHDIEECLFLENESGGILPGEG